MSPRDQRRPGVRPDPADDDGPADPVQALTDFLAAVVEAPPRPGPDPGPEATSQDELGQPDDRDRRGE